jgi:hypothetical protein
MCCGFHVLCPQTVAFVDFYEQMEDVTVKNKARALKPEYPAVRIDSILRQGLHYIFAYLACITSTK